MSLTFSLTISAALSYCSFDSTLVAFINLVFDLVSVSAKSIWSSILVDSSAISWTEPTSPAATSKLLPLIPASFLYLFTTSPILYLISSFTTNPPKSSLDSGSNLVKLFSYNCALTSSKNISLGLPYTLSPTTPNLFNWPFIKPSKVFPWTNLAYTSPIILESYLRLVVPSGTNAFISLPRSLFLLKTVLTSASTSTTSSVIPFIKSPSLAALMSEVVNVPSFIFLPIPTTKLNISCSPLKSKS